MSSRKGALIQYTVEGYRKSLVEWIVARDKPFKEVEDPFFRKLVYSLRSDTRTYSANTIRSDIFKMNRQMHGALVNELQVRTTWIWFHIWHVVCRYLWFDYISYLYMYLYVVWLFCRALTPRYQFRLMFGLRLPDTPIWVSQAIILIMTGSCVRSCLTFLGWLADMTVLLLPEFLCSRWRIWISIRRFVMIKMIL